MSLERKRGNQETSGVKSWEMKSPYEVLGLQPNASEEEVRKAYKKIALENHPDRNNGDEKKTVTFREATEALKKIKDGKAREPQSQYRGTGFPDLDDLFRDYAKNAKREERRATSEESQAHVSKKRGSDISINVKLSLEEVVKGCKKEIHVGGKDYAVTCPDCEGIGGFRSSSTSCVVCSGTGVGFVDSISSFSGRQNKCHTCSGRGWNPKVKCQKCKGSGFSIHEDVITVTVPPGMVDGQQLRVAGRGTPGSPPGDLYISVETLEHPRFRRDGRNLHCQLEVSVFRTFVGGTMTMENLDGSEVRLEIPPMTEPNAACKIVGFGIETMKGKGDLYVQLKVVYPKRVSNRAKKLMEELLEELEK